MKHLPMLGTAFAAALLLSSSAESLAQSDSQQSQAEINTGTSENKPASDEAKPATDEKPGKLTVASWGGAYSESQKRAYFTPFQNETGIEINLVSHNGAFGALLAEGGASPPKWDLVDLGPAILESACRDGKLEKVDASVLVAAVDGTSARDDFLPGMLHECGVPSVAWSSRPCPCRRRAPR